jgi:hypothetical protein
LTVSPRALGIALAASLLLLGTGIALVIACFAGDSESIPGQTGSQPLRLAQGPEGEPPAIPEKKPEVVKPVAVEQQPAAEKKPAQEQKPAAEKPVAVVKKPEARKPVPAEKTPTVPEQEAQPDGSRWVGRHWVTAQKPRAISRHVKNGLAWLIGQQQLDGGWGEGNRGNFGIRMPQIANGSNVAETCMAALALLRSGSSPTEGDYAKNIVKAVEFVCARVEKCNPKTLSLSGQEGMRMDVRGMLNPRQGVAFKPPNVLATTLVQMKIGPAVDTFLATLLLAEVKDRLPDAASEKRVAAALGKLVAILQRHQNADGSWSHVGSAWAPALGQSLAVKGINRARQAGVPVASAALERAKHLAEKNFNVRTGQFNVDLSAASIPLYAAAANLAALQDSVNTFKALEGDLRRGDQGSLSSKLHSYQRTRKTSQEASRVVIRNMANSRFLAGFGANGGEEFLSYLNISEALAVRGGAEWDRWDRSMADNLNRIQNGDGSWSGHHCITGQNFCTAAALLVLLAERTPVPPAAKSSK